MAFNFDCGIIISRVVQIQFEIKIFYFWSFWNRALLMGQPRPLLLFSVFLNKQYNFTTNQCEKCHVHPIYGSGIWTHDLSNMSRLP